MLQTVRKTSAQTFSSFLRCAFGGVIIAFRTSGKLRFKRLQNSLISQMNSAQPDRTSPNDRLNGVINKKTNRLGLKSPNKFIVANSNNKSQSFLLELLRQNVVALLKWMHNIKLVL